ncbi:hypothetical protein CP01DC11_1448A, partial [Chlamydia psittaci 01DC11]
MIAHFFLPIKIVSVFSFVLQNK